jgi:hypothetical protein
MIELKITGATVAEFYSQLAGFVSSASAPWANNVPAQPGQEAVPAGMEMVQRPVPEAPPAAPKETKRRGRPPKLLAYGAEAGEAKSAAEVAGEAPGPTKEDVIARVTAIVEAHAARGNPREVCVDYVRKLFGEFEGVKKVVDLAPEQYGAFMTKSKAFLDGSATS